MRGNRSLQNDRQRPPPPAVGGVGTGVSGGSLGKKKSSTRKYVCQHCGISVRATKDVNIIIPSRNLTELLKLFFDESEEMLNIYIFGNKIIFKLCNKRFF